MGLDGLFGEAEDVDHYGIDGLFHEPLEEDESSILNCNEQNPSGVTNTRGNDLIYQPILASGTKAQKSKLNSLENGKNCIYTITKIMLCL